MSRMRIVISLMAVAWAIGCASQDQQNTNSEGSRDASPRPAVAPEKASNTMESAAATSALDFTVKDIDGNEVSLSKYRGKVVMIVNVASKCGLTPQYEDLQALHERFADDGLAILGFPANDFMSQEPGTNEQIKEFCSTKYGVEFDMFAKVCVKGGEKCELYRYLTSDDQNHDFGGEIQWNFTKFLIGRDGQLIARFEPRTKPGDAKVIEAIDSALKGA